MTEAGTSLPEQAIESERERHEKRLYKRLLHSHHDLIHAQDCAHQILRRKLHDAPPGDDRALLKCLNTALVVSYWRPFSGNRDSTDVVANLPDTYLRVFTVEERKLHDRIGAYRDQDLAHSDAESRSIRVTVDELFDEPIATPIGRDPFVPLPVAEVRQLSRMIERLLEKILEEQGRIQSRLKVGEQF